MRWSTRAAGSWECRRSMPSWAMRSVMSILIACSVLGCTSAMPHSSFTILAVLGGETGFAQSLLQHIHGLDKIDFLEVAKMAHAEDFSFQLSLATGEHNAVLLSQFFQQCFRVEASGREYRGHRVRCVPVIGEHIQAHFLDAPAHVVANALVPF